MVVPKKIYVLVDGVPAELIRINGANPEGKYCVHVKGDAKPKYLNDIGLKISDQAYNEYTVPTKQPAKSRSKKS